MSFILKSVSFPSHFIWIFTSQLPLNQSPASHLQSLHFSVCKSVTLLWVTFSHFIWVYISQWSSIQSPISHLQSLHFSLNKSATFKSVNFSHFIWVHISQSSSNQSPISHLQSFHSSLDKSVIHKSVTFLSRSPSVSGLELAQWSPTIRLPGFASPPYGHLPRQVQQGAPHLAVALPTCSL